MHLLLIALIGITTTQPAILDQTDEEWTAPGYNVIEEVSINPLDYGEPISWGENCNGPTASIGCQGFFVPTEDGEKWRIIMLLKDKLVVLQEDEEVREIPLSCTPRGIIYSRNGSYALIMGPLSNLNSTLYSRESERVNIDTGEVLAFDALLSTENIGMHFLNDDGSVYRWEYDFLEYYDQSLELQSSVDINIGLATRYSHAAAGSIMLFAVPDKVMAYDRNGELLWENAIDGMLPCDPLVSADGSAILLATGHGLECYDGSSGELLWEEYDTGTLAPVPSVIGHAWAVTLQHRGLVYGADLRGTESVIDMRYPAENWSHGIPVAVAENGASLIQSASSPPMYQNSHLRKTLLINENDRILWISFPFSVASSPLVIHTRNINLERELGAGVNSIQSDGNRFIYSDYEFVNVLRVAGR
ncbi:MAG: hypothetical protein GQ565_03770 [Candidatus Aegiribacteria sp.]|nr:hypothetical protein [Candidatus Aegiribacteria sp.]